MDSTELLNALNTLSEIYQDNTPAARRQLRSTIEQRGLQINDQFLEAADSVTKVSIDSAGSSSASAGRMQQQYRVAGEQVCDNMLPWFAVVVPSNSKPRPHVITDLFNVM